MKKSSQAAKCIQHMVAMIFAPAESAGEPKQKQSQNKEKQDKPKDRFELFLELFSDDKEFDDFAKKGFVKPFPKKLRLPDEVLEHEGIQKKFMNFPLEIRYLILQTVYCVFSTVLEKKMNNFGILPPINFIVDMEIGKARVPHPPKKPNGDDPMPSDAE